MAQIEDLGTGFAVIERKGRAEFTDDQVVGLSYYSKPKFSEGMLKHTRRFFLIWLEGQTAPVTCDDKIMAGHRDPLETFIERVSKNYRERAAMALEAGAVVAGDGFALEQNTLTIGKDANAIAIPLNEITSFGIFDDQLRVWQRGVDDAVLKLPLSAKNCYPLELLLKTLVTIKEDDDPASLAGLGRILFERKPGLATIILLWILALIALVIACVLWTENPLFTVLGIAGVVACVFGAINCAKSRFCCHERGVYQTSLLGERELRYDELSSFSYSAVRHYTNGVYSGTQMSLGFKPDPASGKKLLNYSTSTKKADAELDNLRDHISRVIASSMAADVGEGKPVQWTKNLRYVPEGIEYRPAGFMGRKEPVVLPFEKFGGYNLHQGSFMLWEKGVEKPVISESISEDNFFPGFFLFLSMLDE